MNWTRKDCFLERISLSLHTTTHTGVYQFPTRGALKSIALYSNNTVWSFGHWAESLAVSDTFTQLQAFFGETTSIFTLPGCYCDSPLSGFLSFMSHRCNVMLLAGLQDVVATRWASPQVLQTQKHTCDASCHQGKRQSCCINTVTKMILSNVT